MVNFVDYVYRKSSISLEYHVEGINVYLCGHARLKHNRSCRPYLLHPEDKQTEQ
jgi:hypothetical protein